MDYKIELATRDDLPDMAVIWSRAMAADPFWRAMKGPDCPFEEECAFIEQSLAPRMGPGAEMGACQTWKVVDEEGKMIAFAGLGIPVALTAEQKAKIKPKFDFPPGHNIALTDWFKARVIPCIEVQGYDPTKHFQRQTTMVHPSYQRQGIGRMLTGHLNSLADKGDAATYVRARPGAAGLFGQMGYEVLERIDFDLKDFGVDLGGAETKTALFAMKREPKAKEERGKKLDCSGWNWAGVP